MSPLEVEIIKNNLKIQLIARMEEALQKNDQKTLVLHYALYNKLFQLEELPVLKSPR